MKQKTIYCVLLAAALYLPASSKECAKVLKEAAGENLLQVKQETVVETEAISIWPVSPFSRLLFNL